MTVGRICIRNVDSARFDEPIWRAAERMHQRVVGALVVVDELGSPIGILTDRDIVERVVSVSRDPTTTRVGDVMTAELKTIREDASISAALVLMRSHSVRRLPVVDADERLVGLITLDDVLMLLANEFFGEIGALIERQTPQAVAEQ
jgi:CBS domain-containing protein